MKQELLPEGLRLSDDKGYALIRRPQPWIEHVTAVGFAQLEAADAILEQRERIISECGIVALFDDPEKLQGYDSGVRLALTKWSRDHRSQIVAFHILTRSRIVAMGVTVANLALGGSIRAHLERRAFEAALRDEVATDRGNG